MNRQFGSVVGLALSLLVLGSYDVHADARPDLSAFAPLPLKAELPAQLSPAKIELGKKLYFETKLSKAGDLSCNSCHSLSGYGVDGEATSKGHDGQRGDRNAPTVYNAALHFAQFWDGRAKDVEEQALGPIMNPVEMAMPAPAELLRRLKADETYVKLFEGAFPGQKDPITTVNIAAAIGGFERTLITPSRFDKYLRGDDSALTAREQKGLQTFVKSGCAACHSGQAIGGQGYQKMGLVKPYDTKDVGRYKVTKADAEKFVFKVPSLRNIAKTGPYFHDGSVKSLDEAVRLMGEHQLGVTLGKDEVQDIIAFLESLTGDLPQEFRG